MAPSGAVAGRTVLLSSHILAEVEALGDRVSIIRHGRTVESGTLDELRHLTRTSLDVETDEPPSGLERLTGVHDLVVEDHRARFDVDTVALGAALGRLGELGIRSLTSHPPTLEELFLRHYGDSVDEAGTTTHDVSPGGATDDEATAQHPAATVGPGAPPDRRPGRPRS
ncbi:hypothetical protein BH24ACT4_BH24ACT4_09880 [soil metagenome]